MKRFLLPALLLLALLGWWLWPREPTDPDGAAHEDAARPGAEEPIELVGRDSGAPVKPAAKDRASDDDGPFRPAPTTGRLLEGTIVVEEVDGSLHGAENGELWVTFSGDFFLELRDPFRVPVVGGRFSLHVEEAKRLGILRVILADRPAALHEVDRYGDIGVDEAKDLRAVWKAITRVHVVDDETGEELRDVEFVSHATAEDLVGLGSLDPLDAFVVRGHSPLRLPGHVEVPAVAARSCAWWVRASGYALTPVTVDIEKGGDREVRLGRGGAARIALEHRGTLGRAESLHIRLDRLESDPRSESLESPRVRTGIHTFEVSHLAAGPWRAVVVRGYERIHTKSFEILAGETTDVALTVETSERRKEDPELVRLELELVIPDGWPTRRMEILLSEGGAHMQASVEDQLTRIDATTWLWSVDLAERRWIAHVWPTGLQTVVLDPAIPVVPRITLPPPGVVDVQCVWKHDGRPALVKQLDWVKTEAAEGFRTRPAGTVRPDADGRLRIHVIPMTIRITPRIKEDLTATTMLVDVQPGIQEVRLELEQSCGVRIDLYDGETRIPWQPDDHRNTVEPAFDVKGPYGSSERAGVIFVDPPGLWRFTLFPGEGFEPLAPFDLDLERGDNGVRRIEIRRK